MNEEQIITLKNGVTELDHALGPANAAVTMVEYGNFECIDCGRAYPVIKQVQSVLGANLRFVYRHFPTVKTHPHSMRAAEASEAAAAQGKFWQMHDELFTHQGALEDAKLVHYAVRIGLDRDQFSRDMTENTYLQKVQAEYQRSLFDEHITGTPTIYMNGVRYAGGLEVESMLVAIKDQDTEGRIQIPEKGGRVKNLLDRLHHKHGS